MGLYLSTMAIKYAINGRLSVFEVTDHVEPVLHVGAPSLDGVHTNIVLPQFPGCLGFLSGQAICLRQQALYMACS